MSTIAYQGEYFSIRVDATDTEFVDTGDEVLIIPLTAEGDVLLTIEPSAAFGEPTVILPGGSTEPNEEHTETARRELQEDNDFGKRLVWDLRRVLSDDSAVWFDVSPGHSDEGGLKAGEDWWAKIKQELTARPIFIVILSPAALASQWVSNEINMAWRLSHTLDKRIFPVIYRSCDWELAHPDLYTLGKEVSFVPPSRYEEAFAKLLTALELPTDHQQQKGSIQEQEDPQRAVAREIIPRIEIAFQQQDWQKVREYVDFLEQEVPTAMRPRLYCMRGQAFFIEGEMELAREDFDNALTLSGDRDEQLDLMRDIVFLFVSRNLWSEVLRYTQKALRLAPNDTSWLTMQQASQSRLQEPSSVDNKIAGNDQISNIAELLRILRKFQAADRFYVYPTIPANKLIMARSKCDIPAGEQILGLVDTTVRGTAKNSILFGTQGIYYYGGSNTPKKGMIPYAKFPKCLFKKESFWYGDEVDTGSGVTLSMSGSSFSAQRLCDLLNEIRQISLAAKTTHEHIIQQNALSEIHEDASPSLSGMPVETWKPSTFTVQQEDLSKIQDAISASLTETSIAASKPELISPAVHGVQLEPIEAMPADKLEKSVIQAPQEAPIIETTVSSVSDSESPSSVSNVPLTSLVASARAQAPLSERFDKFTTRAKGVLSFSQKEAQRFNHHYIGTEHLLLGLVREDAGVAAIVLKNLGVELWQVRNAVEFIIGRRDLGVGVLGEIALAPRAKKVIELAADEALNLNHRYIDTQHLLLGLMREGGGIAAGVLENLDINLEKVRAETIRVLIQPQIPQTTTPISIQPEHSNQESAIVAPPPVASLLNTDLNAKYREGLMAGNLEDRAKLWQAILDIDPQFGNGTLATQLEELREEIDSSKVQRLRDQAKAARDAGKWEEEIEAWQALLDLEPNDIQAEKYFPIAEHNLKYAWLYENAEWFVGEKQVAAAKTQLQRLWKYAPYYGDPKRLAQRVGMRAFPGFEEREREEAIRKTYGRPILIALSCFYLLSGSGSTLGFVTRSWPLAVGLVIVLALLAYLLSYRRLLHLPLMIGTALVSSVVSFGLAWYASTLHYDQSRVSHFWIFGNQMILLGRQVDFGLILGLLSAIILTLMILGIADEEILIGAYIHLAIVISCVLLIWLIISFISMLSQTGFGFGFGWYVSLIELIITAIGGYGLGASLAIWNKERRR